MFALFDWAIRWIHFPQPFGFLGVVSFTRSSVPSPCLPGSAMGSMGWAPCYVCGWWEYNPYIPDPFTRPFCGHCLTELVEGRLRQCYMCGWWDWDFQDDNPVCEYCLHALALRLRLALPQFPIAVCAHIVYWEQFIDDSWSTVGTVDEADEQRTHPAAVSV